MKGSCIDNIFSNSEIIAGAKVVDWNFSDHLLIMVKRKRHRHNHDKVEFEGRSYKNDVKDELQEELIDRDWDDFYATQDPGDCWDKMVTYLRSFLDRRCPLKKFKVKEIQEPWVTNEILEEIKDKDSSLRVAKRTGIVEDWAKARADRNRVGRLVEQAESDFLRAQ